MVLDSASKDMNNSATSLLNGAAAVADQLPRAARRRGSAANANVTRPGFSRSPTAGDVELALAPVASVSFCLLHSSRYYMARFGVSRTMPKLIDAGPFNRDIPSDKYMMYERGPEVTLVRVGATQMS